MDTKTSTASLNPDEIIAVNGSGLFKEDCMVGLKHLEDSSVDLVLTDPPYNLGSHMKSRGSGVHRLRENHFSICKWDNLDEGTWEQNMNALAQELFRVVKPGGSVILFMSILKVGTIKSLFEGAGFYYKTTGIWHKKNPIPRNMNINFVNSTETWVYFTKGKRSTVFNNNSKVMHDFVETGLTPASEKKFGKHPTQKPLKLMEHFVDLLSNEGDLVCDPFSGSGTSLLSAKRLNRRYIGFELDQEYFNVSKARIDE